MEKNIIYFKWLVEIKMKLSVLIIGGVRGKKNLPVNAGNVRDAGSIPGSGRSLEKGTVFLPGESHGQRSLAGYSPESCKES